MGVSWNIRRAIASDAPALDVLQRAAFAPNRALIGAEPLPLQVPAKTVIRDREVWLAQGEGGGLAGALALTPRADDLEIWSVAVDPARQGGGLGRRLLAFAEERARALGVATLRLYTAEALAKNVAWYGRHGYRVERVEDLPDRRLVHLVRTVGEDA